MGTVFDYHDEFKFLLGKVDLTTKHVISIFLYGLKNVIESQVRMFKPKTLYQAFALAKLQELPFKLLLGKLDYYPHHQTYQKPIH